MKTPTNLLHQAPIKRMGQVAPKQTLTSLLQDFSLEQATIARVIRQSQDIFDPRHMRIGQAWQAYFARDGKTLRYFVYRESARDSVVFDFRHPLRVYRQTRDVERVAQVATGTIENSLYASLKKQAQPEALGMQMRDLFRSDIAFSKLQRGDSFRILYEADLLDGRIVGRPLIKAAKFVHKGESHYRFAVDGHILNEDGLSRKPRFLNAPIKNGVVTSHYRQRRYHPILKRYKAHLGTDYGAKRGTPILAMADGTVSAVAKNRYNGRFVKIRHDRVYETQYLHMTRWAKQLRVGQKVKQGQVIGYVGDTGLAYGYHVCLRLWKNGRQVDFCKQDFPQSQIKLSPSALRAVRELKQKLETQRG